MKQNIGLLIWVFAGAMSSSACSHLARSNKNALSEPQSKTDRQLATFSTEQAQFVSLPGGTFQMGRPASIGDGEATDVIHTVTLTKSFEIQQTEVNQAHWFLVMGNNPSVFSNEKNCPGDYLEVRGTGICPKNPVDSVNWNDTQEFIKKLNESDNRYVYRLPTEAEWEFACRGGTQSAYSFGDDVTKLKDFGWYYDNSNAQTHAVGSKKANPYNLYDMHGNVREWVQDWKAAYSAADQEDPVINEPMISPSSNFERVFRGGAFLTSASGLRSDARIGLPPDWRKSSSGPRTISDAGFRLVRTSK